MLANDARQTAELTRERGGAAAQMTARGGPRPEPGTLTRMFFEAVRTFGVRIAMSAFEGDDASIQALSHIQVDYLKPASHYLVPAEHDELKALIVMAKAHGLLVLAPQIEDARTAAALWTIGIDYVQGNFVQQASTGLDFDFHASAG